MNGMKLSFERRFIQEDYTELLKEMMRILDRSDDKKMMFWVLGKFFQSDVEIQASIQHFALQIISSLIQFYTTRIEAYEKRYEMKRAFSFRPERIERHIKSLKKSTDQSTLDSFFST